VSAVSAGLVLDFVGPSGVYGTRLLAETGHRVIRVESPDGDGVRRLDPFVGDAADLESSAFHQFMNAGKESLALRLDRAAAADACLALIGRAELAVVPRPFALPAERLFAANPRLALVEVEEVSNELCAYARSGLLSLTGQPDREPVLLGGHGALAAIGTFTALAASACRWSTLASGRGQRVVVSGINCLQVLVEQAVLRYHGTGEVTSRRGFRGAVTAVSGAFPCADGYWMLSVPPSRDGWRRFVEWVGDPELIQDASLVEEDERQKRKDWILDRVSAWSSTRSKDDLVREAQARHIPSSPVSTTDDLKNDLQLIARGYLRDGVPAGAVAATRGAALGPAPRLGQHTHAILRELGYDARDRETLLANGAI
jgi:crotonobetainyl-CoA:carnitine CoA-transferase CaiB-like acyl-CoA transferase